MRNKKGFTLLELIVVIIIVGVLASLALPKLFSTIEFSRSTEAMAAMASIRSAAERCFLMNNESYINCGAVPGNFSNLGLEDPASAPNAHFSYEVQDIAPPSLKIVATRNTLDGGSGELTDKIEMDIENQDPPGPRYIRVTGFGVYENL